MTIKKLIKKCVEHILDEGAPTRAISDVSVNNQQPKYGQVYQQQHAQKVTRNGQQVTMTRSQVSSKKEPNPVAEFLIRTVVILSIITAVGLLCIEAYDVNQRGDPAAMGLMMMAIGITFGYHSIMGRLSHYTQLVKTAKFAGWGINLISTLFCLLILVELLSNFRGDEDDRIALSIALINIFLMGRLFFMLYGSKNKKVQ